ncbi:hypothetical protein MPSEU_000517900 [Mayamaea pseudoterrestris]|nr:hypothetical protein MPSEU_000517900 [Mayamaea pseudoterrestris]
MNTKIAEITDRSACTAWSSIASHPDLVVVASKDTGGSGFDATGGTLEIYDLQPSETSPDESPKLLVSVRTTSRFACVDWSNYNANGKYPLGLIVAGMTDGAILIYDASNLLQEAEDSLFFTVNELQTQNTQASAIKSHPMQPYQIAVGTVDGRVIVVDVSEASLSTPPTVADTSVSGKQSTEISAVAWNTQVAHILASSSKDGSVVVWDVAQAKPWCRMQVEHGPLADLSWSPTQGLYLMTASGDDRHPVIQIWDLGASTSLPLMTLEGHRAGILKASWCPHDDGFVLSCGKDHSTFLWDVASMRAIAELPLESELSPTHEAAIMQSNPTPNKLFGSGTLEEQMHMRVFVGWSPLKRGMAMTCSLDRKVQFHSVLALATTAGRVPKWMKPASVVSTAFGGSVVSIGANSSSVLIQTVQEEPELVKLSSAFDAELEQAESMVDFCEKRLRNAHGFDAKMWGFMKVLFSEDPRKQLLLHLGYDSERIEEAASKFMPEEIDSTGYAKGTELMSPFAQNLIKRALLVGNFKAAVDCCFRAKNYADALVVASCGGAELWQQAQDRYCDEVQLSRPYLTLLKGIVKSELDGLVANSHVALWQETLAILSTYAKSDEFPRLCIALGEHVECKGDVLSASLCYLCSGSVEHASRHWETLLAQSTKVKRAMGTQALHEFVVKVSIYRKVAPSKKEVTASIANHFTAYAQALADQGLFKEAAKYVSGDSEASIKLKDRLYRSRKTQQCLTELGGAPVFPFSTSTPASRRPSVAGRSSRRPSATADSMHSRASHGSQGSLSSLGHSQRLDMRPESATPVPPAMEGLPPGWVALHDPSSGNTYFANQTTGETSWDRPQASTVYQPQVPNTPINTQVPHPYTESSKKQSIVSKYGDGFVTSASHPELAHQYGNVGTTNPYSASRPGTAAAVVQKLQIQAPPSGPIDLTTVEFSAEQAQIKDTLTSLYDHLVSISQPADSRQLEEVKKGLEALVKKLARGLIDDDINSKLLVMCEQIGNYDFRAATATQTAIVNSDWRIHKEWLKGLKTLLQLAVKRLY